MWSTPGEMTDSSKTLTPRGRGVRALLHPPPPVPQPRGTRWHVPNTKPCWL